MRPAVCFPHVSGVFVSLVALGLAASLRVLDWHGTRGPEARNPPAGETFAWAAATAVGLAAASVVLTGAVRAAAAERTFTGAPVPSMPQRNAALVATAFVLLLSASLVVLFLALAGVTRLADSLTVVSVLCGPVAAVWYWASTLPYEYLPRNR